MSISEIHDLCQQCEFILSEKGKNTPQQTINIPQVIKKLLDHAVHCQRRIIFIYLMSVAFLHQIFDTWATKRGFVTPLPSRPHHPKTQVARLPQSAQQHPI